MKIFKVNLKDTGDKERSETSTKGNSGTHIPCINIVHKIVGPNGKGSGDSQDPDRDNNY